MKWKTRTSIHLTIVVNDAALHAIGPRPRDHTGWRLVRIKVLAVGFWARSVRSKHLLELINCEDMSADHSKECRSASTCDSGPFDNLDVSNARDNRVVDLEGDSDTTITPAVSAGHASLPFTYLYSTPSLMVTGFFFKLASDVLSRRSKLTFLPGGRVEEASSKVKTVTW